MGPPIDDTIGQLMRPPFCVPPSPPPPPRYHVHVQYTLDKRLSLFRRRQRKKERREERKEKGFVVVDSGGGGGGGVGGGGGGGGRGLDTKGVGLFSLFVAASNQCHLPLIVPIFFLTAPAAPPPPPPPPPPRWVAPIFLIMYKNMHNVCKYSMCLQQRRPYY